MLGEIPMQWKEQLIIPILKSSQVQLDGNSYRPLGLTPNI